MKEEKQHRESEIQIRDSASNTGKTLAEAVRTDGKCSNWQSSKFYGIEFFFTRTDEYFGIVTEDEADWLDEG